MSKKVYPQHPLSVTAYLHRILNTLFLSYIFTTYQLNLVVINQSGNISNYVINLAFIYLMQTFIGKFMDYWSKPPSTLPFAMKGEMRKYPEAVEQWQIGREISTLLFTALCYFVALSIIGYLQLFLFTHKFYQLIVNLNSDRLWQVPVIVVIYLVFLNSVSTWMFDRKHQIHKKDSVLHRIIAIVSLVVLVGVLISPGLE